MNLPYLPFIVYLRRQNLMLRNLIEDYCAQVLALGKHLPLIDHLSFNFAGPPKILNKSSIFATTGSCSLVIGNSLKIENCKLIIVPMTEGAL